MTHIHEVVENLVHWFDDKIFRLYPTWDDCIRAGVFPYPELERFFGPSPEGQKDSPGKANYAQCAQRGIGRYVIGKMLEGTASDEDIRKALENQPITERRQHSTPAWSYGSCILAIGDATPHPRAWAQPLGVYGGDLWDSSRVRRGATVRAVVPYGTVAFIPRAQGRTPARLVISRDVVFHPTCAGAHLFRLSP